MLGELCAGSTGVEKRSHMPGVCQFLTIYESKEGATIIKIDLENAYDRMEWTFSEQTLVDVGWMLGYQIFLSRSLCNYHPVVHAV